MRKVSRTLVAEFKEAIAPARRFIEATIKTYQQKLHALAEYKSYISTRVLVKRTSTNFTNTWGVRLWQIKDALRNVADAVKLTAGRFYAYNRTKYMFRLRLN
jgi:hypothetical protein